MKIHSQLFLLTFLFSASVCSTSAQQQKAEEFCYNPNLVKDTSKRGIKSIAVGIINGNSVKINYHSAFIKQTFVN
ncbi:MAG: hypothetical protein H7Y86_18470 [Rhizobacter sp.]|nr:hypothetical protein [Ferruginibacter sp.]